MTRRPQAFVASSRLVLAVVLGALVAVNTLAAPATPALAEELSPAGLRALETVTACLQARPLLAVTIVIDESRSLRTTDPQDNRAEILGQFMRRIASFSEGELDGREREVYVNIGYFGTAYNEVLAWTEFDDTNVDEVVRDAIEETKLRKDALHTRHRFAIDDTRNAIEAIAARLPARDLCTMVVWFSDGELDPDNNPGGGPDRPAVLEATDELCRADGLLDQLRATGTPLIGIMLDSAGIDRSGTPIPRKREMVEGDGPGGRCGVRPANGVYLEGELDVLSRMFERVAAESQGGTRLGAFSGDPIDFPVDGGVGRIRIVGPAENGLVLTTPSGRELVAVAGESNRGSLAGDAVVIWTGSSVSIDALVRNDYGAWRIVRAGQQGEVDVYYFGDLDIVPDLQRTRLLRGASSTVAGSVARLDGTDVAVDNFSELVLTIDAGSGSEIVEVQPDGSFVAAVDVRSEEAVLPVQFRLVATTQRGIVLQPVVRQVSLPVTLPEEFPTVEFVSGNRFAPGLQRPDDRSTVALELTGSRLGPTRVCIASASEDGRLVLGLSDAGSDDCIDLAQGERRQVDVTAQLRESTLQQLLTEVVITTRLTSAPIDGRGTTDLSKVLRADADVLPPPPNEWVRVLLLVLGIVLPLAVLMFANHRAARFSTKDLQVANIPVVVEGDDVLLRIRRTDSPDGPLLHDRDFAYLATDANGSRAIPVPRATLQTRTPINPFGSIRAEALAADGNRVVSNREPSTSADGRRAGMDLMPQRDAFLVFDDAALRTDPSLPVAASLVVFLTPQVSGDPEQMARVIDDVNGKLIDPARLAVLRDAAATTEAASAAPAGAASASAPAVVLGDAFGSGPSSSSLSSFSDGFDVPSRTTSTEQTPPSPPPSAPSDPGDSTWGSGSTGSDNVWD